VAAVVPVDIFNPVLVLLAVMAVMVSSS